MVLAVSQLLVAVAINLAIDCKKPPGNYSSFAIICVGVAGLVGLAGLIPLAWRASSANAEIVLQSLLVGFLLFEFILQVCNDHDNRNEYYHDQWLIFIPLAMAIASLLSLLKRPLIRAVSLPMVVFLLVILLTRAVTIYGQHTSIDVLNFQRESSAELLHGQNPYAMRYDSIYPPDTPYYGPGVVDENNRLTYGFPYFPLSLLLALPGHLFGDVRYSHLGAMVAVGLLMWLSRPRATSVLTAAVLFLSPATYWMVKYAWTEALLIFTLSLVMYCALRWRKALPIALGIFFATKQYTVLAVPAVWLLTTGPNRRREFFKLIAFAFAVAAAITLPFFLWNPHEFWRAVVQWQFIQPFRDDALSFLVWYAQNHGGKHLPLWTPFAALVPIVVLALWRLPRNPAGFAAMLTLTYLTFFAMNKQAFCNYYFFVIATACWSVAATDNGRTA